MDGAKRMTSLEINAARRDQRATIARVFALWSLCAICISACAAQEQSFPPSRLEFVTEEENDDSFIGHLRHSPGTSDDMGAEQVRFQILSADVTNGGDVTSLFAIDGDGLVSIERLDREALCAWSDVTDDSACVIHLDVAVLINSQVRQLLSVSVTLRDRNDHSPSFPSHPHLTLLIPQEAPIGTEFSLPLATDPDLAMNSVQGYALSPRVRHLFSIRNERSSSGIIHPKLILNSRVARADVITFELIAYDGGDPLRQIGRASCRERV